MLFVHDQAAEERFVAEGWGAQRLEVMYNDFVLIGPAADPAKLRGKDITAASGPLAAETCTTCHTGYQAFCKGGQCGTKK